MADSISDVAAKAFVAQPCSSVGFQEMIWKKQCVYIWVKPRKPNAEIHMRKEFIMHQLIILGNGFDLTCGLKSKFSDFYRDRTSGSISVESIPEDERKAWDMILAEKGQDDPLWCDIESLISAYVFQEDGLGSRLDRMFSVTGLAIDLSSTIPFPRPKDDLYKFVSTRLGKEDVSQAELTSYLLSSLKKYERIFARYLEEQVEENEDYREKAAVYFSAIRDACIEESQQKNYESSILNFNYTTPFKSEDPKLGIVAARNIHGSLGRTDIIFGIDGKDVAEDDPALPFTKTYRLMSLEPYDNGTVKLCDSDTSYIKVFGHSLSRADYSYFQSIFDTVNLYGGETKLVFLYKNYPNKPDDSVDEQAIREELYSRISHLLIEYGSTLDNKDHDKNLMHKLLLEQRLLIKRIDVKSYLPTNINLH